MQVEKESLLNEEEENIVVHGLSSIQSSHAKSNYFQEYASAFSNIKEHCENITPDFHQKHIQYNPQKYKQFQFTLVEELNSFEIVKIKVCIGQFTLHLNVLNLSINSPLAKSECNSSGSYGQVYPLNFLNQKIAVKSFQFSLSSEQNTEFQQRKIGKIIRQYCILKICDALECGPRACSSFGFDLLVFNDRIQFAMEQCIPEVFGESFYDTMIIQLGILHRYKIMHMDINPSNIMFSPRYQKNVFIDFGFSQIIKQDCGFKTQTPFRGTLQFVSQQMLHIFKNSSQSQFIDLYYNDLVCLQTTAKHIKINQLDSNNQKSLNQSYQEYYQAITVMKKRIKVKEFEYLLILLKHEIYFNKQNIKNILKANNQQLIENHGRRVLTLFKDAFSSILSDEIILIQLKELKFFPEYNELLSLLEKQKQKIIPGNLNRIKEQFYCDEFKKRLALNKDEFINLQVHNKDETTVKKIKQNLEICKQKQNKELMIQLLFNYIRFDRKGLNLSCKNQIITYFFELIGLKSMDITQLASIKKAVIYLLEFYLHSSTKNEKQTIIFDLLINCVLLDADFEDQLTVVFQKIEVSQASVFQILKVWYEYYILYGVYQMKHKFDNTQQSLRIIQKIKSQIKNLSSVIAQRCFNCCSKDEKLIIIIVSQLQRITKNSEKLDQKVHQLLANISREDERYMLTKITFIVQLQYPLKISDYLLYEKILVRIKNKFSEDRKLASKNFGQKLYWTYTILKENFQTNQFYQFIEQIKEIINCESIFEKLILKMYECKDNLAENHSIFRKFAEDMIETFFHQERQELFFRFFCFILQFLKENKQIRQDNMDIIEIISSKFIAYFKLCFDETFYIQKSTNSSSKSRSLKQKKKERILQLAICQGFFYDFLLQVGEPVKQYIQQYQFIIRTNFWNYLQNLAVADNLPLQITRPVFFYYNTLKNRALSENNFYNIYYYQSLLLKMIDKEIPNFIFNALILHKIEILSKLSYYIIQEEKKKLTIVLLWVWKYLKINGEMQTYLSADRCRFIIADTLQAFYLKFHTYQSVLYEFLKDIIYIVGKTPYQENVGHYIKNMIIFYRFHPEFFSYQHLNKELPVFNWDYRFQIFCYALSLIKCPNNMKIIILKRVIQHIDFVSWVCKQQILRIYFEVLLKMKILTVKRKILSVYKFTITKIHPQFTYILFKVHQKVKIKKLVKKYGLLKKNLNLKKKKLKEKILKWNTNLQILTVEQ